MVGTRTPQTPTWRGSGYIEFSDEDPVDRAVLVGVHNIKSTVFKVERDLSWTQQEEVRIWREQQKPAGPKSRGPQRTSPPRDMVQPIEGSRNIQEPRYLKIQASRTSQSASGLNAKFGRQERGLPRARPPN